MSTKLGVDLYGRVKIIILTIEWLNIGKNLNLSLPYKSFPNFASIFFFQIETLNLYTIVYD